MAVGAHPGYPDRVNFGRVNFEEPTDDLVKELNRQVNHFQRIAKEMDVPVRYIKPHGALYNQAASDERFARIVCELANAVRLPIVGLPESEVESVSIMAGTPFYSEGFADRRYNPDGTLVPRSEPNALLGDVTDVVEQVQWLVNTMRVRTICVHGDTPGAVTFIAAVRDEMIKTGFTLKAFA